MNLCYRPREILKAGLKELGLFTQKCIRVLLFDQLRKGLYGLYRVWQEGGDGRQGEVEGPGEVGVGKPLLGVLRQQGVEG